MAASNEEKMSSLLQQGLELYGTGDIARAFLLWNEVLGIDPGNEEALDYIRDADRRSKPRGESSDGSSTSLVEEARRLLHGESEDSALELLTSASSDRGLEHEAMIELLRAGLFTRYRAELGDMSQVPRLVGDSGEVQSRNLPPSAGFLLSMVDGMTPISDLISVSGMDRFEAVRAICQMHDAGILEWES
jgi:hypothetical protein